MDLPQEKEITEITLQDLKRMSPDHYDDLITEMRACERSSEPMDLLLMCIIEGKLYIGFVVLVDISPVFTFEICKAFNVRRLFKDVLREEQEMELVFFMEDEKIKCHGPIGFHEDKNPDTPNYLQVFYCILNRFITKHKLTHMRISLHERDALLKAMLLEKGFKEVETEREFVDLEKHFECA